MRGAAWAAGGVGVRPAPAGSWPASAGIRPAAGTWLAWARIRLALAGTWLALASGPLAAQEPDTARAAPGDTIAAPEAPPPAPRAAPGRSRCALVLEPRGESTVGTRVAQAGGYVTYIGGGMTWRCGNAVMEADSAVKYDVGRRVEMIGRIRYRDTIRTLRSNALTYFELFDLVVATGNVRLTRLASGSTLEGPRVEFLRAVSGAAERTTATGRPHMTLYSDSARKAPPFEVDADRAVFEGEDVARTWGDVVIRRPDLDARADSAFFDVEGGTGVLYGSPSAEGEGFRLTGDTLRLRFEDEELREVRALGRGRAAGRSYDVRAEEITIRVTKNEVDAVWAHGPGRSVAVSRPYRVFGDSLRFVLSEGQIDTVLAVGSAVAIEEVSGAGGRPPEEEPGEEAGPGEGAVVTDTVLADEDVVVVEPAGADTAVADTVTERGEPAVADTSLAVADSVAGEEGTGAAGAGSGGGPGEPRLSVDGESTWVAGDTVYVIFEPPEETAEPLDEEAESPEAAAAAGPREAAAEGPEPAVPDSVQERRISRMVAVGGEKGARAFYVRRDTVQRGPASRNYLIGRRIDVIFREGRAHRVLGERAIGVYLDPVGGRPAGGERPPAEPADTARTGGEGPAGEGRRENGGGRR